MGMLFSALWLARGSRTEQQTTSSAAAVRSPMRSRVRIAVRHDGHREYHPESRLATWTRSTVESSYLLLASFAAVAALVLLLLILRSQMTKNGVRATAACEVNVVRLVATA